MVLKPSVVHNATSCNLTVTAKKKSVRSMGNLNCLFSCMVLTVFCLQL